MPNCRGLLVRTGTMRLPTARPTRLVSRNVPKSSGNSVTTSIRTMAPRQGEFDPLEPGGSQHDLVAHRIDEVLDERQLDRRAGARRSWTYPDDQRFGARVTDEVFDDAHLAGRADERRADDVAHVELPFAERRKSTALDADEGAAKKVGG